MALLKLSLISGIAQSDRARVEDIGAQQWGEDDGSFMKDPAIIIFLVV